MGLADSVIWSAHEVASEYSVVDVATVTDLLHRAYARLAAAGLNYTAADQLESETRDRLQRGVSFFGRFGGRLVATATLYLEHVAGASATYRSTDTARFGQFAVEPALQGKGVGSRLLARLERVAEDAGKAFVACDTAVPARHLIEYYQARDYRIVERVHWRGKTYDSEILRKRLVSFAPKECSDET